MLSEERIKAIAEKYFPPPAQPSKAVEELVAQEQAHAARAIREAIDELTTPIPCVFCGHKHAPIDADCSFAGCACPY